MPTAMGYTDLTHMPCTTAARIGTHTPPSFMRIHDVTLVVTYTEEQEKEQSITLSGVHLRENLAEILMRCIKDHFAPPRLKIDRFAYTTARIGPITALENTSVGEFVYTHDHTHPFHIHISKRSEKDAHAARQRYDNALTKFANSTSENSPFTTTIDKTLQTD